MKRISIAILGIAFGVFAQAQPLDTLLEWALESQPDYRAQHLLEASAEHRIAQERAWDPPQLQAGYGLFPVETRVGPQLLKVGAQQAIPWTGHTKAKAQVARAGMEERTAHRRLTGLDLRYSIQNYYYSLEVIHRKAGVMEQQIELTRELIDQKRYQMESGRAALSDVLILERNIDRRTQELRQLDYRRKIIYEELSHWLARSVDTVHLDTDFEEERLTESQTSPPAGHPALDRVRSQKARVAAERSENQWAAYPRLLVGLDYIVNLPRTNADLPDNGRDALIPRIGLTLPFLSARYSRNEERLEKQEQALDWSLKNEQSRLRSELSSAYLKWREARSDLSFYEQQLETNLNIRDAIADEVGSGAATFFDYWQIEEEVLQDRLRIIEAKERMQRQKFIIQKIESKGL